MREILYRGKAKSDGKWIIGDLQHLQRGLSIANNQGASVVTPETVGQYTGLQDRNGKRIFEGDIVRTGERAEYCFCFSWGAFRGQATEAAAEGYPAFGLVPADSETQQKSEWGLRNDPYYWAAYYGFSVVGNIHDNPEYMPQLRR